MQLNGKHGLTGWRWIFILEGVVCTDPSLKTTLELTTQITGFIGILCFVFLVDFPDRAHKSWRFLNERECAFIIRRINEDRNDGDMEAFSLKKFLKPAADPKIWGFAMIFLYVPTCPTYIQY